MRYRHLIILVLLGGMAIIGASIVVGISHRDVEIVENAYEAGLRFDEQRRRFAERGWKIELPRTLQTGDRNVAIVVRDRTGAGLADARVALRMFRTGTNAVLYLECANIGGGRYSAPVRFDAQGSWSVQVRVQSNGDSDVSDHVIDVLPDHAH